MNYKLKSNYQLYVCNYLHISTQNIHAFMNIATLVIYMYIDGCVCSISTDRETTDEFAWICLSLQTSILQLVLKQPWLDVPGETMYQSADGTDAWCHDVAWNSLYIWLYVYIYIICHVCLAQACASCTLLSSCSFGKYGKGDPGNQFYPGLQENLHASYLKGNLRTKSNPQ